jgi:hypothetical protein
LRDIKVLHIEPTDVCQAACPLCARETDPKFCKDQKHHLTIGHIQQHFNDNRIKSLDKVFMCGNYGDPAAGAHTSDIYKWFRQINPTITLGMNTNGAIQNTFWWNKIGRLFNQPRDYVVFSIDGLEDTNAVYRKGVTWPKLMQNAQAFIEAGGSAHWDMLIYQHNEHQVDECEQLARNMGFKWFRAKVSKRPLTDRLEWPRNYQAQTFDGAIQCHAQQEKSAYIDAQGNLSPCCWIGATQIDFVRTDSVADFVTKKHATCVKTCSTDQSATVFLNQWRKEIELC